MSNPPGHPRGVLEIFAHEGTQAERVADVSDLFSHIEPVMEIVSFINEESNRAICQPLFEDAA